jgi:hypothetical protein
MDGTASLMARPLREIMRGKTCRKVNEFANMVNI